MATATTAILPPPSPPPTIVYIREDDDDDDDDDDDVSLFHSLPPTVSRRTRRTPRIGSSGTNANNPISVDNYSDHHHHDVAVIDPPPPSSSHKRTRTRTRITPVTIDLSGDDSLFFPKTPDRNSRNTDDDDEVQFIRSVKKHGGGISITEPGESSNSSNSAKATTIPTFMCEICVEPKPYSAAFFIMGGCTHSYCSECIVRYVAAKLQDNITQIRCPSPSCPGLLEHDQCRLLLPKEVFDRWGNALCEAVLLANLTYYCPFKDCSAPLLMDGDEETRITESECPNCRRLFCVKCKVAWHVGITCEDFQKLNKDERGKEDLMLMQLAKEKKWTRCPKCRFYVEKSEGCLFMKCRCGHTFCYNCGAPLRGHYCKKCKH